MGPRPLRLPESSDDEAENDVQLLNSGLPENPVTLDISDDEFLDAEEYPLPTSPPAPPPQEELNRSLLGVHLSSRQPGSSDGQMDGGQRATGSPVEEILYNLGVRPRAEWLQSCMEVLSNSKPGFVRMTAGQQAELCFAEFLFADMNTAGDVALPPDVHTLHATEIGGPIVLQVDEIVNLSSSLRERYKETPAGGKRCLKLSMTDGVQRIFGIEYRPIKDLMVLSPAGMKIAVRNVHIRRGLLMLVPEVVDVLGGFVEHMEAARQRLVEEVNKPPRGKRNSRGQEVSSLASRALVAAWPSGSSNDVSDANGEVSRQIPPIQSLFQGPSVIAMDGNAHERSAQQLDTSSSRLDEQHNIPSDMNMDQETLDSMEDEVDHPLLQNEETEIPFTYLACLKAKTELKSVAQGKIKCILTGVKVFQFKDRDKFELIVYVDDGSLISDVLIDHQVVQNILGHSPRQVTALLTGADRQGVDAIKETMKRFQVYLRTFEGQMLVEINEQSEVPVVLEMTEGCQTSDAWLLLHRVKSSIGSSTSSTGNTLTIEISP
eukprot:Gb_17289 [translate_table: standard]